MMASTDLAVPVNPTFNITITADTICAWCYIHHVRLSKAIRLFLKTYDSTSTFSITYKPYLLQPQLSKTSVPVADKFLERFGKERAGNIQKMMDRIAEGDSIKFSRTGRVGDSRSSHCVIAYVGQVRPERQRDVVGEMMRRYYEEGADITDEDMLIDCAVGIGEVDGDGARDALTDQAIRDWVEREAASARDRGIDGVPHMEINGIVLEGAKDVEDIFQILINIKEKQIAETGSDQPGQIHQCSDGICT